MTDEEGEPQLLLQHSHLTAQRRLRNMQAIGGLAQAPEFGDVNQGP